MGRQGTLDARQRTITFVRPRGLLLIRPGRDRVVAFVGVRRMERVAYRGSDAITIAGRDIDGSRVRLSIDSSMTDYYFVWTIVERVLGDRVPKPMELWKFAMVLLGIIIVGVPVIAGACLFVFWVYDGFAV